MATTSTYPIAVPKAEDLIVGTQTYTAADPVLDNPTKNFTVQSIVDLAAASGAVTSLTTTGTSGASTLAAGVLNVPNYTGIVGPSGPVGADGAPGATGAQGIQGIQGDQGTQGIQGIQGVKGDTGDTGPIGPSGGVSSVTAGLNIAVSPTVGDVVVSAPNAIVNTTDTYATENVTNVISLTQVEYDAIVAPNVNTLYIIL